MAHHGHIGLETKVLDRTTAGGFECVLTELTVSRDHAERVLHVKPVSFIMAPELQCGDFLFFAGFRHNRGCPLTLAECYWSTLTRERAELPLSELTTCLSELYERTKTADKQLRICGLSLAERGRTHGTYVPGDGHAGTEHNVLEEATGTALHYALTVLRIPNGQLYWVVHISPISGATVPQQFATLFEVMGLSKFQGCLQSETGECWWFSPARVPPGAGERFSLARDIATSVQQMPNNVEPALDEISRVLERFREMGFSCP